MTAPPPGQGNRTIEVLLERIANALEAIQRGDTSTPQDIPPIVPPSAVLTKEQNAVLAFLNWSTTGFRMKNGKVVNIVTVQEYQLDEIWSQMTEKQRYRAMKELEGA